MTVWLELEHVRLLCYELAVALPWIGAEPIPAFDTRFPGRLESCLAAPKQSFAEEQLYPTLIDQAAILFYLLNKDHPFANGNKRIALTTLLVFLLANGKWLRGTLDELYEFSVTVAASDARQKDRVVDEIKNFILRHLVDTPPLRGQT